MVGLRQIKPRHKLGNPALDGDELRGNIEAGQIAQSRATVHALEPGITGGRRGRRGRAQ